MKCGRCLTNGQTKFHDAVTVIDGYARCIKHLNQWRENNNLPAILAEELD